MSTPPSEQILSALDDVDRTSAILRGHCLRLIDVVRAHEARVLSHDGSVVGVIAPKVPDEPPSVPA